MTTAEDAKKGRSDCYCIVQLGSELFRTQTSWKTATPFWGEEYTLSILNEKLDMLNITVFDEEPGSKDVPVTSHN